MMAPIQRWVPPPYTATMVTITQLKLCQKAADMRNYSNIVTYTRKSKLIINQADKVICQALGAGQEGKLSACKTTGNLKRIQETAIKYATENRA